MGSGRRVSIGGNVLKLDKLIAATGTTKAMIELFVALGVLPKPVLRREAGEAPVRCFPPGAVARIEAIQKLRAQGVSLAEISLRLRDEPLPTAQENEPRR